MPFLRAALDDMNCNNVLPKRMSASWTTYCSSKAVATGPARAFASMDCGPEVCVLLKRRMKE